MKPCPPCTNNCNQGRNCPAPQACELPEDDGERGLIGDLIRATCIALGVLIVAVILVGAL